MTTPTTQALALPPPLPNEDDETYCRRVFNNEKFRCYRCNATIYWPGVCDRCAEKMNEENDVKYGPMTTQRSMAASGVPAAYESWTWAGCTFPQGMQPSYIRAWTGDPAVMSIVGPVGSGKTGVAVCMARDWVLNGSRVKFLYVPDWLDDMRQMEREDGAYYEVKSIGSFSGLLIMDEIATNRITDYGVDRLLQVIDARVREGLPVVVTSNIPPKPVKGGPSISDMDERLGSRLAGGLVIRWVGSDQRRGR